MQAALKLVGLGVLSLLLTVAAPVRAQPSDDGGDAASSGSGPTANRVLAGFTSTGTGEVQVRVNSFGVGNRVRPGDWVGVEVELTDSADKARNVVARIACEDLDKDVTWMQRTVVTNPGSRQSVWLYFRMPYNSGVNSEFLFTAHEAHEVDPLTAAPGNAAGGGGVGSVQQFRAGRLLGSFRYRVANDPIKAFAGLIGVVGTRGAGVEQYQRTDTPPADYAVTGHEVTHVLGSLSPATLPDRWMGLSTFEALVWTGANQAEQPNLLREGQAEALREWIKRGGHLCIVLPPVAQAWIGAPSNPLADLMPAAKAKRVEGVDLNYYRALLTRERNVTLPLDGVVHAFEAESPGSMDAIPIMTGPDGDVVVMRRLVGEGAVTVIGFDLASRKLTDIGGALQADQLWHRILGKRPLLISQMELDARRKSTTSQNFYSAQSHNSFYDRFIAGGIASQASTSLGVLLAFVVFLAYWLLAGPLGYGILKARKQKQHSWVAFLAVGGLFTLIAWGSANTFKIRSVQGKHVTFIDGVYGQTSQRARSWMSVFLPRYGDQRLSVASSATAGETWHNAIAPWDPNGNEAAAAIVAFTDARGYAADARAPETLEVPARATTKQVQVDWAGVLPLNWGMIRPLADSSVAVGQEIRVRERPTDEVKGGERRWMIDGTLIHNFPAPLRNVSIWYVGPSTASVRTNPPLPWFSAWSIALASTSPWQPNTTLALDEQFPLASGQGSAESALSSLIASSRGTYIDSVAPPSDSHARAISFFSMLPPPNESADSRTISRREATHGLDLSRWFTQPSVIVIGEIEDGECPIPLSVDNMPGEEIRKHITGRTIVRWVYPLAAAPLKAPAPTPDEDKSPLPQPGVGTDKN